MSLLHKATLNPSKLELISGYLPTLSWFPESGSEGLELVGAYRFDDPANEVGVEIHIVKGGSGQEFQIPLTYRAQALEGAEAGLVGMMEHSVLGSRWVYNGCVDPVFVGTMASAILTGGTQAELLIEIDGEMTTREPTVRVKGSGTPDTPVPDVAALAITYNPGWTVIISGDVKLAVVHVVDAEEFLDPVGKLVGTWDSRLAPAVLAALL